MEGRRAALAASLALALVVSCGGSAGPRSAAATSAAAKPSGAPPPKLLDLLAAAKLTQYRVTYHLTASGGAQTFSGDQTWYFAPPRARFDFAGTFGPRQTSLSFFVLPDGAYYCFATSGRSQCFSVGGIGSPLDQNFAALVQRDLTANPDKWGGTFKETRTIAGLQAYCYEVTSLAPNAPVSSGSFCYSTEGIALLSQFSASGGRWSMEATSVSMNVPDSDFTLPATPTTLGFPTSSP